MKKRRDLAKIIFVILLVVVAWAILISYSFEVSLSPLSVEFSSKGNSLGEKNKGGVVGEGDIDSGEIGNGEEEILTPEIISTELPSIKPFDTDAKLRRIEELQRRGTAVEINGRLVMSIIDDFENERSEERYELIDEDGERYKLYFGNNQEFSLRPASELSLNGKRIGNEIIVEDYEVITTIEEERNLRGGENPNLGEQRMAVILLNKNGDSSNPISVNGAQRLFFDETFQNSVTRVIRDFSYNQAWLSGDVFGPYQVESTVDFCNFDQTIDIALSYADEDIYFLDYNRLIILVPLSNPPCDFSGLGGLGYETQSTQDGTATMSISIVNTLPFLGLLPPTVIVHEMGHNFGAGHASRIGCLDDGRCAVSEYGNFY